MKERCYNPNAENYPRYGARGIAVCDRWRDSFESFVADNEGVAKPGLTLERVDNDGPYSPENCMWVTMKAQAHNRRDNRLLTYQGRTQILSAWADEVGIGRTTLDQRLKAGWSVERALTQPVRPYP